ncbi:ParB N-terminal domain-containing protein [Arthrobacter sp. 260]|uniref:ParB/RepB/Spo0J family partition protein n=1 Tax=Arthrobacter sp. 260 TaxID=2735314 RepID=UPI0014928D8B|nr:ParB N-terminal domain-containing protein [Arthrobacter sp. 260]NOJ60991.1 ParB N-terminal domain-containing protein [Arthrobacter sp. 260]
MSVLEMIDPTTLTIDANVRADVQLDKAFLASIKEHGVIQPVVAHRTDSGGVHVLYGQRRSLAAVEAKLDLMPVYVVESLTEADRLAKQVVENDQRQGLTDNDRAGAFHQLSLLGVSATQIAKKTGAKKATVDAALKVRADDTASAALAQGMTLDMAAVIEEFSGDAEAITKLETTAAHNPQSFDHTAQRLRDDRTRAALMAEAAATVTAHGLKIVDEDLNYYDYKGPMANIRDLRTIEGVPLTDDDADAAHIGFSYNGEVRITLVNTDWKAAGFTKPGATRSGPMTEDEKAERRRVIENNKAWDAAETVRVDFLKTLLKGKTAPKNALRFIAQSMGNHSYTVADGLSKHTGFAAELLGGKDGFGELAKITAKPTGRHETNTLAVILAGFEKSLTRQSWRNPSGTAKHYLTQLTTWDYTLSEVETIITDHGNTETQESVKAETSAVQEPGETFAQVPADEEELTAEEADYAEEA